MNDEVIRFIAIASAVILICVLIRLDPAIRRHRQMVTEPQPPEPQPPEPQPPESANTWRGVVLSGGSSSACLVPVKLHDGRLADARFKSVWQWSVVPTGSKVFGSIDADGKYIVEGIL